MGRINQGKSADANGIHSMRPHHRSMARAVVAGGLTPGQLAETFGFSVSQVSAILGSPVFMAELERLEERSEDVVIQLREDIKNLRNRAIEVLDEDLHIDPTNSDNRKMRQKAAISSLEFTLGKKEPGKVPGSVVVNQQYNFNNMSEEELRNNVFGLLEDESD